MSNTDTPTSDTAIHSIQLRDDIVLGGQVANYDVHSGRIAPCCCQFNIKSMDFARWVIICSLH